MSAFRMHVVLLGTLLVLALGLGDPQSVLAATLAVALTAVLAIRVAVSVAAAREVPVGARARSHRQLVLGSVEPSHPTTPGRPMGRAPSEGLATA
jgi:hypothetical protein